MAASTQGQLSGPIPSSSHICKHDHQILRCGLWSDFPAGSEGKEPTCHAGGPGLIPGLGRALGSIPSSREGQGTLVWLHGMVSESPGLCHEALRGMICAQNPKAEAGGSWRQLLGL